MKKAFQWKTEEHNIKIVKQFGLDEDKSASEVLEEALMLYRLVKLDIENNKDCDIKDAYKTTLEYIKKGF